MSLHPGQRFRTLVEEGTPLQIAGCINPLSALIAKEVGFKSIYLSGAGVANANFGLADLALTSLNDVEEAARRICERVSLPLLVDIDTGWGSILNIAQTIHRLERTGTAAVHLEDQAFPKRCGHRQGKTLISTPEMCERLKAALDAREHKDFVIMARTDAYSVEGLESAIERAKAYQNEGADMIFAESLSSLEDYQAFCQALPNIPVLANITEFGKTPLLTASELNQVGVKMVLYPLTAFRAMNKATKDIYTHLLKTGTQKELLPQLQTREELYELIGYHEAEKSLKS